MAPGVRASFMPPCLWICLDCEFTGPTVDFEIVELGAAAVFVNEMGDVVMEGEETFSTPIRSSKPWHPATVRNFWDRFDSDRKFRDSLDEAPSLTKAMNEFSNWIYARMKQFGIINPKQVKFISAPASTDWLFLRTNYERVYSPKMFRLGYMCYCFRSMIEAMRGQIPHFVIEHILGDWEAPHYALGDALLLAQQLSAFLIKKQETRNFRLLKKEKFIASQQNEE